MAFFLPHIIVLLGELRKNIFVHLVNPVGCGNKYQSMGNYYFILN